jgi:hypothetical protein
VWLIGLGVVLYLPLIDVLAQLGTRLLLAAGAVHGESGWLGFADTAPHPGRGGRHPRRARWPACAPMPALRWLAVPAMVLQALAWITLLTQAYQREQLPPPGTGVAMLLVWLGLAWCLKSWRAQWAVSDAGLKGLHFGRVIAPWLMLPPVISLNLMPWLVGDYAIAQEMADSGWVVEGMWPDYIAAWAAIGLLFAGLAQVRRAGWPLEPLQTWYGRAVIPLAALWSLLLVVYWNLRQDGSMAPLPYLPVLNPLDLTTGFVALLLADLWRLHGATGQRRPAPAGRCARRWRWPSAGST